MNNPNCINFEKELNEIEKTEEKISRPKATLSIVTESSTILF